jgi:hypothetical protein
VIAPHVFLPVVGWRWMFGIAPTVMIYAASANEQLRAFGIYYAIVLVPFLVIGASAGAMTLALRFAPRVWRPELVAATVVANPRENSHIAVRQSLQDLLC